MRQDKPNSFAKTFLRDKLRREAPSLTPEPVLETAAPANVNMTAPEVTPIPAAVTVRAVEPRPQRSILKQGEEARLGRRKNKRVPGLIRGGRDSPDWPEPVVHVGAKMPAGFDELLGQLALGHRLHRWQVLDEAVRCFIKTHGPRTGGKSSS